MWDPDAYRRFDDHRGRPFHELIRRIGAQRPRRVVDMGCGPGTLTETLVRRWPEATLEAFDSSAEMVRAARGRGIAAEVGDVRAWAPRPDTDVAVCNAVLQWVPGHGALLRRWAAELPAGSWLAMQVPGNFAAASHVVLRDLAAEPVWRDRLAGVGLLDEDAVLDLAGYATLLAGTGCAVDAWETTYLHQLDGPDPVLAWLTGTGLRPVRSALDDDGWTRFRAELAPRLRQAYPVRPDGSTWLPFRRLFVVARTGCQGRG
jgi:trans-aconitate 2-methyltransferase